MPFQITTKDGITIRNIPDDVDANSQQLKDRVAEIRAQQTIPADAGAKPSPVDLSQQTTAPASATSTTAQAEPEPVSFLDEVSTSIKNFNDVILNTATFGASDTIKGAISALQAVTIGRLVDGGVDPQAAFQEPAESRKKFQEDNPKTAIAASIVGGFLNPVSKAAGPLIAGGRNVLERVARGAAGGSVLSGAQAGGEATSETIRDVAAGRETDIPQKASDIQQATAIGAAFGGFIPAVGQALRSGFNGIVNTLARTSNKVQGTAAVRKITEALERDGFTPSQALKRLDELGPDAALLDAGPNARALGFTVKGQPGAGKKRIEKFISERQEGVRDPTTGQIKGGQVQRIQNSIDELIPGDFFSQRQQLANINNASKLYDNAFAANQNIESRTIDRLLKTPDGQVAFKNARRTLNNNRENLSKVDPDLTELLKETGERATGKGVGRGLKLKFLDQVKRELFDLEQKATDKFGRPTERSRSITNLRRDLIDELDNVDATAPGVKGGDYAKARLLAGDKLANQEALEKGAEFMSKGQFSSPREIGAALEDMSPEARHLFRVGAAQGLKSRLSEIVSRADASKKLIDIQALEGKISAAFGDETLFRNYTKFMTQEKELFRAVTDVLGGSQTAERGAALADAAVDPGRIMQGLRDLTSGDLGRAARGIKDIVGGAKDKVLIPETQGEALAKVLTGRSIKELTEALPVPQLTETGALKSVEELVIRGGVAGEAGLNP